MHGHTATTTLRSSRRTVVGTAMNMATRSNGDVLAVGFHDVQDLILGTVDFLDIWVNLQVSGRYLAVSIPIVTHSFIVQKIRLHTVYAAAGPALFGCCASVYAIASATYA
jgi:hypothetical protein